MCFEKTGIKSRSFNNSEQTFALSIALVFSSTLEARQRRALQDRLDHELKEKELLIKEVHHRVKNNLTIISGLINLQSAKVKDVYHKLLFEEHRSKIDSIAAIHELVYKSKNFTEVNLKMYIQQIVQNLQKVYYSDRKVAITYNLEDIVVALDMALPLGLIMNEVITNAYKHAFTGIASAEIRIELTQQMNNAKLIIADNGVGLNLQEKKEQSLGMDILIGLVEQIEAKHHFTNDNGTVFTLEFKVVK
jgi:two-component sensor histidine kinase